MKTSATVTHVPQDSRLLVAGYTGPVETHALTKADPKVGSTLPTFSAPPIDEALLSNLNDAELVSVAKTACSIHTQAGAYAREFLAEMKRRFDEGKKIRKLYLGYKNFNNLCADKLEISARQVRNILNHNPSGRKGRAVKPRPSLKELEEAKAENRRLKAHVRLIEADNDRVSKGPGQQVANFAPQEVEQAKKDAIRDYQKIAVKESQESDKKIAALESTVRKLTEICRSLEKQRKQATSKSNTVSSKPSVAVSPYDDSRTSAKEDVVRRITSWTLSNIKEFTLIDKRQIVDEVIAKLRDDMDFEAADAEQPTGVTYRTQLEAQPQPNPTDGLDSKVGAMGLAP